MLMSPRRAERLTNRGYVAGLFFMLACTNGTPEPEVARLDDGPPPAVLTTTPEESPPIVREEPRSEPTAEAAPTSSPHAAEAFPASAATLEADRIVPRTPIGYATGKPSLLASSADAFIEVKLLLESKPAITLVRVEVHTDSTGADARNLALSKLRALEVARGLVKAGVPCKKLVAVGFGESKPVASNDTPQGREQNRRTEFVVAGLRDKLIGGGPADGGGDDAGDPCS